MHYREWQRVLNRIEFDENIIDEIKERLVERDLEIYVKWKGRGFDINYLFPFQSGDINNECTLLHIAARSGHTKIVETLLKSGAEVNAVDDKYGITPLHWAARNNHIEVIGVLLAKGAIVDAINKDLATSLHVAARNGHTEAVKVLLTNNANIGAINRDKATSLHWAARNGYIAVVEILLAEDANVDAVNRNAETPLHWAARNGHIEVVKALLEKGANAFLKTKDGQTPRDLASRDDVKQLLEIVESKEYLDLIIVSVIVGCAVALLQTAVVIYVSQHFVVAVSAKFIACVIVAIALASGFATYARLKPNTQVNEIQTVGVYYNPHNSEISMV